MNQLQKEILSIYKEVKRVCDKNKIRYYAIAGTALGAIRHKGFIPWDDDMDLGIPIDDFEKFKKACKRDLKEPFDFIELNWAGGKVHNKNTTFLETQCLFDDEKYYGVFVDIFPLVGVPEDEAEQKSFFLDMRRYFAKAFTFDRYTEASKLSKKEILELKSQLCKMAKYNTAKRVVEFSISNGFTMRAEGLKEPCITKFEDSTVPVSSLVKEDLKERYGDFMKLPPINQRKSHTANAIVDFKHSYTYYTKKINEIDPDILSLLKRKHKIEGDFFNLAYTLSAEYETLDKEYKLACSELAEIKNSRTIKLRNKIAKVLKCN